MSKFSFFEWCVLVFLRPNHIDPLLSILCQMFFSGLIKIKELKLFPCRWRLQWQVIFSLLLCHVVWVKFAQIFN